MWQKNKQTFKDLWHCNKRCNIHFIKVQEGKKKEGGAEKVPEEIMSKNLPNLARDRNLQIEEGEQTQRNPHQNTL